MKEKLKYCYTGIYSSYNRSGEVEKEQKIQCSYTVEKDSVVNGILSKIWFQIDEFQYAEGDQEVKEWKFAKLLRLPYYIYRFDGTEDMLKVSDKSIYIQIFQHFNEIEKIRKALPKLPATYLVYMVYFDLIAFEEFTSKIESCKNIQNERYVKIEDFSGLNTNMLGLFGGPSEFQNGDFYVQGMGKYTTSNQEINAYDYYCLNSDVKVVNSMGYRRGLSNYYGNVKINRSERSLFGGVMMENFLPKTKDKDEKYGYILRAVEVKRLDE